MPDYPPVYGPGKAFFFVGKGDPDQVKAFLQRYGGAETTAGHRDRLVVYAHFVYILIYTAADFDGCPVGMDDLVRQVKFVINKLAQGHKKLPGGPAALGVFCRDDDKVFFPGDKPQMAQFDGEVVAGFFHGFPVYSDVGRGVVHKPDECFVLPASQVDLLMLPWPEDFQFRGTVGDGTTPDLQLVQGEKAAVEPELFDGNCRLPVGDPSGENFNRGQVPPVFPGPSLEGGAVFALCVEDGFFQEGPGRQNNPFFAPRGNRGKEQPVVQACPGVFLFAVPVAFGENYTGDDRRGRRRQDP